MGPRPVRVLHPRGLPRLGPVRGRGGLPLLDRGPVHVLLDRADGHGGPGPAAGRRLGLGGRVAAALRRAVVRGLPRRARGPEPRHARGDARPAGRERVGPRVRSDHRIPRGAERIVPRRGGEGGPAGRVVQPDGVRVSERRHACGGGLPLPSATTSSSSASGRELKQQRQQKQQQHRIRRRRWRGRRKRRQRRAAATDDDDDAD